MKYQAPPLILNLAHPPFPVSGMLRRSFKFQDFLDLIANSYLKVFQQRKGFFVEVLHLAKNIGKWRS